MAEQTVGNRMGVAACNPPNGNAQETNMSGGSNSGQLEFGGTNYDSVFNLKLALALSGNPMYTAAKLNTMTYNDLVYAVRVLNDPNSITPRT